LGDIKKKKKKKKWRRIPGSGEERTLKKEKLGGRGKGGIKRGGSRGYCQCKATNHWRAESAHYGGW